MKRVEIRRILPKTVFKAVLMAGAIPYTIFLIFGMISIIVGASQNGSQAIYLTVSYLIVFPLVYGLIAMLLAFSYNLLAPKFGGLIIEIEDTISEMNQNEKRI